MLIRAASGWGLSAHKMPQGGDWVLCEHARPAVAHDLADPLAHFRFVAMVFAGIAAGLDIHLPTASRSLSGVGVKLRTLLAHGLPADR